MAAGIVVRRVLAVMLPVTLLAAVAPLVIVSGALAGPTVQTSPIASTAVQTSSISVSGTAGNFFFSSPGSASISWGQIWEQDSYGFHEHIRVVAATKDGKSQYTFDFGTPLGKGYHFVDRFYRWAREYSGDWLPGRPAISVHGNQPGCANQTGSFEVRDIHRSGGNITRLWLVFERWCNDAYGRPRGVEHGELRLGYPATAYDVSPRVVVWPWTTVYPGQSAPDDVAVTVRLTSSSLVTAGTPSVSGADAADFPIRRQDCTGAVTAAGCTVWVGFAPTRAGPRHATLTVPTSAGPTRVSLDGTGGVGTSTWTVDTTWPGTPSHEVIPSVSAGDRYGVISQGFQPLPPPSPDAEVWTADFSDTQGLTPGTTYTYQNVVPAPPFTMDIAQGDGGCEMQSGSVRLNDLGTVGPDHLLSRLDALLKATCKANPSYQVTVRMRFHEAADLTSPSPVTGLQITRSGSHVALTWKNPPDSDLAGVIIRWSPARNAPSVWWAGRTAYFGTGTAASFTAPATGPISITTWTYDKTGNVSNGSSTYLS